MGVAKSLRKAGYLSPLASGMGDLASILEANRKKEEQKQFFNTVVNLFDKWQQGQEKAGMTSDLKEGGQVNNVLSPENLKGIGGAKPTGLNLGVNLPANLQNVGTNQPPETQTREISPKERYSKGQKNLDEFMQAIVPLIMNPDVDESTISRTNVLGTLAQQQAEKLKPKEPTYFNLNQGDKRFMQDESGIKEVAFNPKFDTSKIEEYERDENGNYKVYTIEGQKYYNKLKKDAQGKKIGEELTRIPTKGEGKTTVNINPPEEKGLKDTTAKLIADLKNFKPYTVNEEGTKIPMDEKDIKYAKDTTLENIKLQLLANPRAYEFVTNIEQLWKAGDPTGSRQYLSPKELYNEALKHAQSGEIDEEVQDQIATYLRYYSDDIYKGLTTNASK